MAKSGYTIVRKYWDEYWQEQEVVWFTGTIHEQGELLFEGLKQKLGIKDISLTLLDKEGNVIERYEK